MLSAGPRRVTILTVGCKLNQADTEALRAALESAGHDVSIDQAAAEVCIVNTCTVTAEADRDSRRLLRRLRRENPSALVIAVGCYAETDARALEALAEVDWALGRAELTDLPFALLMGRRPGADPPHAGVLAPRPAHTEHARARLVIQDGCDRFCTYCKVPLARGRERSLPAEDVLRSLRELAERAYAEIVLVGCNVGAWGRTLPGRPGLASLLRDAAKLGLPRLRLGSIEPEYLTDDLVEVVASSRGRICPHLHVPLQSGSPAVLRAMGRSDELDELSRRVEALRSRVGLLALGLDVLVGFPTEGEEDFEATLECVRRLRPSRLHVFPYSPRPGTEAVALGDPVPRAEKKRRVHALLEIGKALEREFLEEHVGREAGVAIERRDGRGTARGTTETYVQAEVAGAPELALVAARVTGVREGVLVAEAV